MHFSHKEDSSLFFAQLTLQPSFAFHKEVVTLREGYLFLEAKKNEGWNNFQQDNATPLASKQLMKSTLSAYISSRSLCLCTCSLQSCATFTVCVWEGGGRGILCVHSWKGNICKCLCQISSLACVTPNSSHTPQRVYTSDRTLNWWPRAPAERLASAWPVIHRLSISQF